MNESIDFISVNYNSLDYAEILVKSISKYSQSVDIKYTYDTNIIIIDNSKYIASLEGLRFKKDLDITILKGDNNVDWTDAPSPASAAHANSIQMGIEHGTSKYICICDIDICFLNPWIHEQLPKLEKCGFISHRWESDPWDQYTKQQIKDIKAAGYGHGNERVSNIARPQFMVFKREWYEMNEFVFNARFKDTGGFLTKFCHDNKVPIGILANSYNNPELKQYHWFPEIKNGEQAFLDNGSPFMFHHGRGTLGPGHPNRKQWFEVMSQYLLI